MRIYLIALALIAPAFCGAGEPAGQNLATGPRVEVTPADSRAIYWGNLLKSHDGIASIRTESGESRDEKLTDLKSLRFVSGAGPLTAAEQARLKELTDKDSSTALTPAETAEYFRLRERIPVFAADVPPNRLKRLEIADNVAKTENSKERIELYVAMLRKKLKRALTEEEVRDLTMLLALGYHHAGYTIFKTRDLLQKDVEDIDNPELRKKILNRVPEPGEPPRPFRPEPRR